MKSLVRFLARLYPEPWRQRYGDEFDALLYDSRVDLRTVLDVLLGAIKTRACTQRFWKIAVSLSMLGAVIGFVVSYELSHRPIPVEVRAVDRWPSVISWNRFETCATAIGTANCGFKTDASAKPVLHTWWRQENRKIVIEFPRGDAIGARRAREQADNPRKIESYVGTMGLRPEAAGRSSVLYGIAAGLLVAIAIVTLRAIFRVA